MEHLGQQDEPQDARKPSGQRADERTTGLHQKEALPTERDRFVAALVDLSPDILYTYDLVDRKNIYIEGIQKVLGYSSQDVQEMGDKIIPFLMHPDDLKTYLDETLPRYSQAKDAQTISHEYRMRHRNGQWRWLESREIIYTRQPDGSPREILGAIRDITDRKRMENTLEMLKKALDASSDAAFCVDREGRFTYVNESAAKALGYTRDELMKMCVRDVNPRATQERWSETWEEVRRAGTTRHEVKHRRKDGCEFPVEVVSVFTTLGAREYICAFARDITERKRTEDSLRIALDRAQSYLDTVESMIVALDANGRVTLINRKGCRLFGCSEEDLIGQEWFRTCLPQPDGMTRVHPVFLRLIAGAGDALEYYENPILTKSGQVRQIAWHNALLRDEQGRVIGTLSAGNDITERKRAEEELQKLASVIRHSGELVNLAALDGTMTFINEAGARVLGVDPDEVGQVNIMQVIPDHLKEMVRTELLPTLMGGGSWEGDLQYRNLKTGQLTDVHAMTFTVTDPGTGAPLFLANVSLDITERKQAEEEKARLQAQLLQAQKMESVGRLAGGVAHDFNNMLSVILGHAEMALKEVPPAQPLYAGLEEIRKAAKRSADLTRQLLAFARKQTIAPTLLDLNETVAGMLKMLKRLIGEDVRLDWKPEANLWPVKVDPSQIDQILANLVVNARDAIAGVGDVVIQTRNSVFDVTFCRDHPGSVPGDYVCLAMSDNGCGMDKETLSHLFEPFFTTKKVGEGTGLGLATVYGIVKQNNGFIDVRSQPGQGTTFAIYLPRHAGAPTQARTQGPAGPAGRASETILLVEDEPAVLDMTKTILEKEGYAVLAANAPAEAFRLAHDHPGEIHLLVTDVVMPEMNGRDLAESLLSSRPRLKCLFISGYTADVTSHGGVIGEALHFIQKPFSIKGLAAKVRETLDGQ